MTKITKFPEYLESQGILYPGKTFSAKYIKLYFIKKTILSAFVVVFCLFFHKNILYTSEVIALLLTAYIIHQQIFSPSLKPTFTLSGTSVSAWNWLVLVAKYHTSRKIIHN